MKASDVYGRQPMQMDDYGMDKRHYDSCNSCNSHDNHEPEKTEDDETTDLKNYETETD